MGIIRTRCRSLTCVYHQAKLLSIAILVFVAGFPAARSVALEPEEIADAYEKQAGDLESLYVRYCIASEPLGSPFDIRKYFYTLFFENQDTAFAFKGNKRYSKIEHPNGGVYDDLLETDPDGSPKEVRVTSDAEHAFDGALLYYINDTAGSREAPAAIVPKERNASGGSCYFDLDYMSWPLRMLPDALSIEEHRSDLWLPGVIELGNCHVRPGVDTVDGAECIVMEWRSEVSVLGEDGNMRNEPRDNVVWCDQELGYAVRQRETYFVAADRILENRYSFSQFIEVIKDVWLPQKCLWDRYAPESAPPQLHNTPLIRYTVQVSEIHANDVPDSLFALSFPPGSFVRDERYIQNGKPIFYTMPASGKELEAVIQRRLLGEGGGEVLPPRSLWIRLGIGGLLLLVILLLFYSSKRASMSV